MSYCVIKRTLEETSLFVSRDVGSCYQDYYYSLAVHVLKYTGGLCRVRARRHVSSLSQSLGGCTNPILTRPPPGSITTVMLLRLLVRRFSQYDDLRCGRTGPLHSSRLLRLPHHTTSGGQSILEPLTKHCGLALFCQ